MSAAGYPHPLPRAFARPRAAARGRPPAAGEGAREAGVLRILTWGAVGAVAWTIVARAPWGGAAASALFAGVLGVAALQILLGRLVSAFALLAYLAAVQPGVRLYATALPYLALEYTLPLFGLLLLLRLRGRVRPALPWVAYGLYLLVELIDLFRAEQAVYARGVFVPSFTLFFFLVAAAQMRIGLAELRTLATGLLAGTLSLAALIVNGYATGDAITWRTASNFAASGGMGPNQVALIFGASVFLCILLGERAGGVARTAFWSMGGGLTLLMVLTFSRGGMVILLGGMVAHYLLLRRPSVRSVAAMVVFAALTWAIFDFAIDITGGAAAERYTEMNTSNRGTLMQLGFRFFVETFPYGLGTGNFYTAIGETEFGMISGAHNELTRAAAEHGVAGLLFWLAFVAASVVHAARGKGFPRGFRLSLLLVALVTLAYNGLKLTFQPVLFMIALSAFSLPPASAPRARPVPAPRPGAAAPGVSGRRP